jgi:beta-mannanase
MYRQVSWLLGMAAVLLPACGQGGGDEGSDASSDATRSDGSATGSADATRPDAFGSDAASPDTRSGDAGEGLDVGSNPTTSSASKLLKYLKSLPTGTSARILSGVHSDYYSGNPYDVFSSGSTNASNANINSYVPSILSVGVEGPYNGTAPTEQTLTGNDNVVALANAWIAAGGIVQVSAWFGNPSNSTASAGVAANSASMTPNAFNNGGGTSTGSVLDTSSATYAAWIANLSAVATLLAQIDGPVLFRPFIEVSGNWFWFGFGGGTNCTGAQFQSLWTQTHDYFTVTKGLTNLLFEYNVNENSGADTLMGFVAASTDIVSTDAYDDTPGTDLVSYGSYAPLVSTGLPIILAEMGNGVPGTPSNFSYETVLQDIKTNTPNVVALSIWCQGWELLGNPGASAFLTDPWIVNRPGLPAGL